MWWLTVKYTLLGKIGAVLIGAAPLLLAVEMASHIDALIAAIPPTAAVVMGVIALKRGQKTMMVSIDGRMEQLLSETRRASLSEGKETERTEARDRREEIKIEIKKAPPVITDVKVVNTKAAPVQSEDVNRRDDT